EGEAEQILVPHAVAQLAGPGVIAEVLAADGAGIAGRQPTVGGRDRLGDVDRGIPPRVELLLEQVKGRPDAVAQAARLAVEKLAPVGISRPLAVRCQANANRTSNRVGWRQSAQ